MFIGQSFTNLSFLSDVLNTKMATNWEENFTKDSLEKY
jgi:hypothetical protein